MRAGYEVIRRTDASLEARTSCARSECDAPLIWFSRPRGKCRARSPNMNSGRPRVALTAPVSDSTTTRTTDTGTRDFDVIAVSGCGNPYVQMVDVGLQPDSRATTRHWQSWKRWVFCQHQIEQRESCSFGSHRGDHRHGSQQRTMCTSSRLLGVRHLSQPYASLTQPETLAHDFLGILGTAQNRRRQRVELGDGWRRTTLRAPTPGRCAYARPGRPDRARPPPRTARHRLPLLSRPRMLACSRDHPP